MSKYLESIPEEHSDLEAVMVPNLEEDLETDVGVAIIFSFELKDVCVVSTCNLCEGGGSIEGRL